MFYKDDQQEELKLDTKKRCLFVIYVQLNENEWCFTFHLYSASWDAVSYIAEYQRYQFALIVYVLFH